MEPVRVKLYGLFPVTKRRYLRQLVLTELLLAVLLVGWWFLPNVPVPDEPPPHLAAALWLLKYLPWIVAGLGVLVQLEAFLVFRSFARAEAARSAPPAGAGVSAGSG